MIVFVSSLANAGGIGGGALLTPIYIWLYNFSFEDAIPLSKMTIFTGAVINYLILKNTRLESDPNKPLINEKFIKQNSLNCSNIKKTKFITVNSNSRRINNKKFVINEADLSKTTVQNITNNKKPDNILNKIVSFDKNKKTLELIPQQKKNLRFSYQGQLKHSYKISDNQINVNINNDNNPHLNIAISTKNSLFNKNYASNIITNNKNNKEENLKCSDASINIYKKTSIINDNPSPLKEGSSIENIYQQIQSQDLNLNNNIKNKNLNQYCIV